MAVLPSDQVWRVVGGVTMGGILVRKGKDTSSEAEEMRLQTGCLIKELELDGERLHYFRIASAGGPDIGWVSTKLKGKDLVQREEFPPVDEAEPAPPLKFDAIGDRKIRILAVHGAASNSNMLKFMMSGLVKFLGSDMEWVWSEGPLDWQPVPGGSAYYETERTELEVRISKGMPFKQWFLQSGDAHTPTNIGKVDEGFRCLEEILAKEAPIDVIVGFSGGAQIVAWYIEQLRRQGKPVPWRLNILFSAGATNDVKMVFRQRSVHPTVLILGEGDKFANVVRTKVSDMFTNLIILEHREGHNVPRAQPVAGQIFSTLADEIKKHCGKT